MFGIKLTIDQLISVSASVAAMLAAIATFLTVRQIAKQRRAMHRPNLYIDPTHFKSDVRKEGGNFFSLTWWAPDGEAFVQPENAKKTEHIGSASLHVRNFGLGAALNISVRWSFPMAKFVDSARRNIQNKLNSIFVSYSDDFVLVEDRSAAPVGRAAGSSWKIDRASSIEYVLPGPDSGQNLSIPRSLIAATTAAVCSGVDETMFAMLSVPEIELTLKYEDIGGTTYQSSYYMKFHIWFRNDMVEAVFFPERKNRAWRLRSRRKLFQRTEIKEGWSDWQPLTLR